MERNLDDPACLGLLGEPPPPMPPSHFALVHGIEPFERVNMKPWDLHTIPTDKWYDRAKAVTDECELELSYETQGAKNGLDDSVTLVTSLLGWDFSPSRPVINPSVLAQEVSRLNRNLDRKFRMVLFIPRSLEEHLHLDPRLHFVIHMNASVLPKLFPFWDRVQAIRTSKLWTTQAAIAGWLASSPQAKWPGYNPFEMTRLGMLRAAARINPWGSRYHLFLDSGHLCFGEQKSTPAGTSFYREMMSKGMFVTHWPYGTQTEVHGFNDKAMHLYMAQEEDPFRIVRSRIFGGDLPHIECVLKAFIIALHQTLSDGYLGRDENIWTIVHRRLPHLFSSFDNNSLGNHGDNCASFVKSLMVETDILAGKAMAFVSPPVASLP